MKRCISKSTSLKLAWDLRLGCIFLCQNEEILLKHCLSEHKPHYYKRYVDDIFLLFENEDQVVLFKNQTNA